MGKYVRKAPRFKRVPGVSFEAVKVLSYAFCEITDTEIDLLPQPVVELCLELAKPNLACVNCHGYHTHVFEDKMSGMIHELDDDGCVKWFKCEYHSRWATHNGKHFCPNCDSYHARDELIKGEVKYRSRLDKCPKCNAECARFRV